ncbi:berberine/berberine-like, FAD-binding, type 2 [Artemisia annua]|uniref:Berberine/berberine-like, FAD-binding, type 2 n=1 Tax=Artemisia annua TaxID=35608 RepID=A0A2U1L2F1_ARTAN|nr:berberine/berberine-like, FAD-binding, type 2 [Artemisia annua]
MSKQFPELGLKKEDCFEVSYIQAKLYWANFDYNKTKPELLMDRHSDTVKFIKRKSDYVQTAIPKAGLTVIFNKLLELGKVGLVFNPYGGKMNEVPANAVPFPHRAGNLFKVQYSMNWEETDPKTTETILNQGKAMYEFMTPYVSKNPRGAFINYRDFDIGVNSGDGFASGKVYGEKYFKGNFERLVKIKTAVDPDNFFRNEQSIPTLPKRNKGIQTIPIQKSKIQQQRIISPQEKPKEKTDQHNKSVQREASSGLHQKTQPGNRGNDQGRSIAHQVGNHHQRS